MPRAAHTLGNALRDVMWSHPYIELAAYTQEHPSTNEIILRCQTTGAIPADQGFVEALHMTQLILGHMSSTMDDAVERWQRQPREQQQQQGQQQAAAGPAAAAEPMDEDGGS